MYNINTDVSETVGQITPIVGPDTPYLWSAFGSAKVNSRTDNNNMQNFKMNITNSGNNGSIVGLNHRATTNSRNARSEIHIQGRFLRNTNGLQWYIMRADYSTKDRAASGYGGPGYHYHSRGATDGGPWNDEAQYTARTDFSPGTRYYLFGIDSDITYVNNGFATNSYNADEPSWGFISSIGKSDTMKTRDTEITFSKEEKGRIAIYVSKMSGLDFVKASAVWKQTTVDVNDNWFTNKLKRDVEEVRLARTEQTSAGTLDYDKPQVLYEKQFRNAEEILRVGHLRFRRVADANPQKSGSTVIDLIEWYGIIPILNVPKTVGFTVTAEYFKHHTNNAQSLREGNTGPCNNCVLDNLDLDSGRYVIDIDSACFYASTNYRYKYSKKAWILSSLANMRVTIESDTIDRIMPISAEGLVVQGLVVDDDDFLNRI